MNIKIGNDLVGDGQPMYTIAEVGSNFDGSLERAKKLIDLAKYAGANAVKFQCFKAEKIVSKEGFSNLKMGFQAKWKKTVYETYKDAEFPREWLKELFDYCKQKKITFLSTPYDREAVDLLDGLGVEAFKVGSGDITWLDFLEYIAKKNKPIILATGASTIEEVTEAVNTIKNAGNSKLVLLQCVTNYPSSFEHANIRVIQEYQKRFKCLVGYSDHTPGHVVALGTLCLGGCLIEKHFTDDKTREGPDHPFAMDFFDFKLMVDNIRLLEKALGSSEKRIYPEEEETVVLQRRCIRAKSDIKAGTRIKAELLEVLRPAPRDSIPPKFLKSLIGKELMVDVSKGQHLTWGMIKKH